MHYWQTLGKFHEEWQEMAKKKKKEVIKVIIPNW